ncbi:MAG: TetR/AcrR family transcriptional regulator [Candidatus Velthaea sp.]
MESPAVRRLLLAAVNSFSKNGFHAASTRAIASQAKLSPAAVYVHFKSKEELLYTIIVVVAERLHEQLLVAAQEGGSATDQLRRIVMDYVAFPASMYKAARVANTEFGFLNSGQRKKIVKMREAMESVVENCLERGCAAGEFEIENLSLTKTSIMAFCRSVLTWYSPSGKLSPSEVGAYYADCVEAMVRTRRRQ